MNNSIPCVFLDRDGTINVDTGYPHRPQDIKFIPGVLGALSSLHKLGWRVCVVTNQSGIGRGLFTKRDLELVTSHIGRAVENTGGYITRTYFCPHDPTQTTCMCRKPGAALLYQAADDLGLDLSRSWMVGDQWTDVAAGQAAGCHTILLANEVAPKYSEALLHYVQVWGEPDYRVPDLAAAVEIILNDGEGQSLTHVQ